MLMDDLIFFDRYYCINSALTKEIMVRFILKPRHIFILVNARFGWSSVTHYQHVFFFPLRPVTSINFGLLTRVTRVFMQ